MTVFDTTGNSLGFGKLPTDFLPDEGDGDPLGDLIALSISVSAHRFLLLRKFTGVVGFVMTSSSMLTYYK